MIRQMIEIDEELCNGCGICVDACEESALKIIDGKAKLIRDDYCDGLGNCLPACPTNAIRFVQREALPFNEEEVKKNMEMAEKEKKKVLALQGGCPGSRMMSIQREQNKPVRESSVTSADMSSQLVSWPIQIKLVPVNAPYFDGANLLIAADCTAFAYGNFHEKFMKNKITLIGCPKLDNIDYSEKLAQIIKNNNIKSVTITRMQVPCCGGMVSAVKQALIDSGKMIPWNVVVISTEGELLED